MNRRVAMFLAGATLVGLGLAAVAVWTQYLEPRRDLDRQIEASRQWISFYEQRLRGERAVEAELKAWGAKLLASTAEETDARLRSALAEVASVAGLGQVQVGTGAPAAAVNPVAAARVDVLSRRFRQEAERGRPDFWVIRGDVSGSGTLQQALRTLALLQAQPWVHRVESVSLQPAEREKQRFAVRVGVSVAMAPDLAKAQGVEPQAVPLGEAAAAMVASLVERSPFSAPETPRAASRPPRPAAAPPAAPALGSWRLTGIIAGSRGVEATLVHGSSGQRLALRPGERVEQAVFVAGAGEQGTFEIEGKRYRVRTGATLEQREAEAPAGP